MTGDQHLPGRDSTTDIKWVNCPACQRTTPYSTSNLFRPFCSKLCRATDLGRWAQEEFRVATTPSATQD
ncbi:MAG: DNA gyrase inhibitor YacG [Burkholderiaceae bacterium]